MGGGYYDTDTHHARAAEREEKKIETFAYHQDVQRGHNDRGEKVERRVHPTLDPYGKIRESRDNEGPSKAIAIVLDVTGSMRTTPQILQKRLPALMALLQGEGFTNAQPQVLFAAIGDSHPDRHGGPADEFPIQIGQFEGDIRIEDHMTNMILEGNGGGQNMESYELALYYFGKCTSIDCFEKRGEKGYLFIFGDEHPYPAVNKKDLTALLGVPCEADIPLAEAVKAAQDLYNVFFIVPGGTFNANDSALTTHWGQLLGPDHVLKLGDVALACETVGLIIGLSEGKVLSLEDAMSHLHKLNHHERTIVRAAIEPYTELMVKRRKAVFGERPIPGYGGPGR